MKDTFQRRAQLERRVCFVFSFVIFVCFCVTNSYLNGVSYIKFASAAAFIVVLGWIALNISWELRNPSTDHRQGCGKSSSTKRLMELLAANREIKQPIKTVCAWCKTFISGDPNAGATSHGCCLACRDIHFNPIRLGEFSTEGSKGNEAAKMDDGGSMMDTHHAHSPAFRALASVNTTRKEKQ